MILQVYTCRSTGVDYRHYDCRWYVDLSTVFVYNPYKRHIFVRTYLVVAIVQCMRSAGDIHVSYLYWFVGVLAAILGRCRGLWGIPYTLLAVTCFVGLCAAKSENIA